MPIDLPSVPRAGEGTVRGADKGVTSVIPPTRYTDVGIARHRLVKPQFRIVGATRYAFPTYRSHPPPGSVAVMISSLAVALMVTVSG